MRPASSSSRPKKRPSSSSSWPCPAICVSFVPGDVDLGPASPGTKLTQIAGQGQLELDEGRFFGRELEEAGRIPHAPAPRLEPLLLGLVHRRHPLAAESASYLLSRRPHAPGAYVTSDIAVTVMAGRG